jgi:hypothetical protein
MIIMAMDISSMVNMSSLAVVCLKAQLKLQNTTWNLVYEPRLIFEENLEV